MTPRPSSTPASGSRPAGRPSKGQGEQILVRGARQNNLTGVDVTLPKGRLIAVTGVSGSGKSSLAFDTLFREGQRRFLETLSAYARQFLGRMEKPDVDSIEGLAPAIAVDQKSVQRGPRSTVGTLTEVVDHLRVLYARAGTAHCPEHHVPLEAKTPEAVLREIGERFAGQKLHLLAPVVRDRKGQHRALLDDLARRGLVRVRVDGEVMRIEEVGELERYKNHTIEAVVDRLTIDEESQKRLRESLDQALELGKGDLIALAENAEQGFSTLRSCPECGVEAPPLEPRLFSFNSPHGACPECNGLGLLKQPSERLVVRDPELSIEDGALAVTRASGGAFLFPRVDFKFLDAVAVEHDFDLETPWQELTPEARHVVLEGAGEKRFEDKSSWSGRRASGTAQWKRMYAGVLPALREAFEKGQRRKMVERFLSVESCPGCAGSRLNENSRAVRVAGVPMRDLVHAPIDELEGRFARLDLSGRESQIAEPLLLEIRRRLAFLREVGLGYLTLDRPADSLSGGEAQRIRLAAQLGAGLQGVMYVLDEPSIGLHARDHDRLLAALRALRDLGNTVIVVEHDESTLRAADHLVDIGPGAGRHGGQLIAEGPPGEVAKNSDSPTGRLLRGELPMPRPETRREGNGNWIELTGAAGFNLKGVDLRFPLGTLTAVGGVSGSGKSTLINRTLVPALLRHLGRESSEPQAFGKLTGEAAVEELVVIDAAPIGRTPRSNPATYVGAFTPIRDLFAQLPESRMRGWEAGRFSFNVAGGRCETCMGAGSQLMELQFLAPVTVPCEECGGERFSPETLEARYKGHSIADVLEMTAEDALELFSELPKIARPLETMVTVGVGYLTLGQPSTTLSGGEAQRIKLAKYLKHSPRKHTLFLLDEPTTGLHHLDVVRLLEALQQLVDSGHSVLVIEHHLDVLQSADWLIDLGPEGGEAGGEILGIGTPEEIAQLERSHTARALRQEPAEMSVTPADSLGIHVEPLDCIRVVGARTNTLKNISIEIPRDSLTVITGPSGSGKSSLALDTIFATGRQRFVESLSTYARQFLAARDRAPVDRIEGLGPSVSVEARTSVGHPRSTVATTTEVFDHLRVLWARAGQARCPLHDTKLERTSPSMIAREVLKTCAGERGYVLSPIAGSGPGPAQDAMTLFIERRTAWGQGGFARALVDGTEIRLEASAADVDIEADSVLDLVVDRTAFKEEARSRLAEAIEQAANISGGRVSILVKDGERLEFSTHAVCPACGFEIEGDLEPRHFSFNTHVGACPSCDGLGVGWQCDAELILDDHNAPLVASKPGERTAISGKVGRYLTKGKGYYEHLLRTVAASHRIDLHKNFGEFSEKQQALLLYGEGSRASYRVEINKEGENYSIEENFTAEWKGLCGAVDSWHERSEDPEWRAILEKTMERRTCRTCKGERLAAAPRSVTLGRKRLPELLELDISGAGDWVDKLRLPAAKKEALSPVLDELSSRLGMLERVGLGYIALSRAMSTLSGGEARRVRLAASLGSRLTGVCYVLDEPTVGLHPSDIERLAGALLELRDLGNTVLCVEHDEELMRCADYLIDMGPGAGRLGGEVVAEGTPASVAAGDSLTGRALRGELRLERRGHAVIAGEPMGVKGAKIRNLKNVDLTVRQGEVLGVCGPSGSGKSTLVLEAFVTALRNERSNGRFAKAIGVEGRGRRVVLVDASPIGRTPSSVPATAVGLMDPLRELFSRLPEARVRGMTPASFSFNSTRGRCPACEGRGAVAVEMQFLADLWLECEECRGKRYRPDVLAVRYRSKSMADVLEMPVSDALELFGELGDIERILRVLENVGLGYLSLGQSSTTLSGGEAQRVKLATELLRAEGTEPSVLVLDEPSTGLHQSDLVPLVQVLQKLADRGDAVVIIEHHTSVLAACDRLVELGPAGGAAGGRLIAEGTPEQLSTNPDSPTGRFLAQELEPQGLPRGNRSGGAKQKASKKQVSK